MTRWLVSQLGAREHYAVARALHRDGNLLKLCTDVWANRSMRSIASRLGRRGKSLAGRYHREIPDELVHQWNRASLWREATHRSWASPYDRFLFEGRWFANRVKDWLDSCEAHPDVLFSYDTTALESFQAARQKGIQCVLGQMDPGRVEAEIVSQERERWPGWERVSGEVPEAYHQRREAEWQLADTIIVNSAWSKRALIQQGVPERKLEVVPLVYEPEQVAPENSVSGSNCLSEKGSDPLRRGQKTNEIDSPPKGQTPFRIGSKRANSSNCPLRVLFLGQVNLRKGIPYLIEAAGLLAPSAVTFTVVGPVNISQPAINQFPENVRFLGPVSRNEVAKQYREADVFVLPTLSDGFAITQLEAMANGLPVVATNCCGDVVTHGKDGYIVPAADAIALANTLSELALNRDHLLALSANAFAKSQQFGIMRLQQRLNILSNRDHA